MATGLSSALNAQEVNFAVGRVAKALNEAMIDIGNMKIFLDTYDDAALAGFGLSSADIIAIRSAYTDLANLFNVYLGTGTQATPYDFRTFARRIWGFGFQP